MTVHVTSSANSFNPTSICPEALVNFRTQLEKWIETRKEWPALAVDLSVDAQRVSQLDVRSTKLLHAVVGSFIDGEGMVESELSPLLTFYRQRSMTTEQRFVELWIADEMNHRVFFERYAREVLGVDPHSLKEQRTPSFRAIFDDALPRAMRSILSNDEPDTLIKAVSYYTLICEGLVGEAAFELVRQGFGRAAPIVLPGLHEATLKVKQDEGRHIGFGLEALRLFGAIHGKSALRDVLMQTFLSAVRDSIGVFRELEAHCETDFQEIFSLMDFARALNVRYERALFNNN